MEATCQKLLGPGFHQRAGHLPQSLDLVLPWTLSSCDVLGSQDIFVAQPAPVLPHSGSHRLIGIQLEVLQDNPPLSGVCLYLHDPKKG